jgi:branched-chain amino acid transport system permease protein
MDLGWISVVLSGITLGSCYALIGLGLNITFGTMRVVNIAHGEFVMLGAYFSYFLFLFSNGFINPFFSLIIVFAIGYIIGVGLYLLTIKRVEGQGMAPFIVTFGLSIFLSNFAMYVWTPTFRAIKFEIPPIQVLGISIPTSRYLAAAVAWIIIISVELFMSKIWLGKAIEAVAQDRVAAQLVGVNPVFASMNSFAISCALGCVAGSLLTIFAPAIYPYMGIYYRMIAFLVGVLGGLGSYKGALVGGLIIGILESVSNLFVPAAVAPFVPFLALVIVLIIRPRGMFGVR